MKQNQKKRIQKNNSKNLNKLPALESDKQQRAKSRNEQKILFNDGSSENLLIPQKKEKSVKTEIKLEIRKSNLQDSFQIDSSSKTHKKELQPSYEDENLLDESIRLQADLNKERVYPFSFEAFTQKVKFLDIQKRARDPDLFLNYVKEIQFPNYKETTDQSENSNITSSRESQFLKKRKAKQPQFSEVKYSKKVAYPDIITNLLNPKMTGDLKRELQKKLSETVDADPKLADLVIQFAYKDLLTEFNQITSPFQLLTHLLQKDLRMDEICEVLLDHIDEIKSLEEGEKRQFGLKFIEEIYNKKFQQKQHMNQWKQLSPNQQNVAVLILSSVKNDLVISIEQASIVAGYVNSLETPEQREDAFWQLFFKQKFDIKVAALKSAFMVSPKIADLVSENFNELFQWEILNSLANYALDKEKIDMLKVFVNIKRDYTKFTQVIKWLQDKSIHQIVKKFLENEPILNFDTIQQSMNRLYDKIANVQFEKHVKDNLHILTNPTDLNRLITNFFDSGIAIRNVNAGKKIRLDLLKKLKELSEKQKTQITEKEVFEQASVVKSLEYYSSETAITLYVWQKQIIQYAFYVSNVLKKNCIIQVPTGHGKTIIIAALARALQDKDNGKVVIVTMNSYLNYHAMSKYGIPNQCNKFPDMPKSGKTLYLTNAQLMSYNESKLEGAIIIYDEIDRCFQDQIASIQQDIKSKKYFLKFPPMILRKCKSVIGFTGTLSQSTLKQTEACNINEFIQISLRPTVDEPENDINDKKVYKNAAEREKQIIDVTRHHLKEGYSVIIIDDQLKPEKQILKLKDLKHQLYIFDQWGTGQFAPIDERLSKLYSAQDPIVVHTNMHGVRGVDFKIDMKTHVILAFNPRNYYDIVQALGRGARILGQRCDGTIVISQIEDKHQVPAANILNYYKKMEQEEETIEKLRMDLLIVGHGKEMNITNKEEADKLAAIFKERQSLLYQEDELEETAQANWNFIRNVFPDEMIAFTPVEFLQEQNDLVTEQVNNHQIPNIESNAVNVENSASFS